MKKNSISEVKRKNRSFIYCPNCGKWKSKVHFARYGKYAECRSCANVKDEIQPQHDNIIKLGVHKYVVRPTKDPVARCLDCALYDEPQLCEKYDCTDTYLRRYNAPELKGYHISAPSEFE